MQISFVSSVAWRNWENCPQRSRFNLYNTSNYSCILIGSRLSFIRVQTLNLLSFLYHGKENGSMLPLVWSVLGRSQRTSKCAKDISETLDYRLACHAFVLTSFHVIWDLLLNRRTATWNVFVNLPFTVNHQFFNFCRLMPSSTNVKMDAAEHNLAFMEERVTRPVT